jgi:hypothetical protein
MAVLDLRSFLVRRTNSEVFLCGEGGGDDFVFVWRYKFGIDYESIEIQRQLLKIEMRGSNLGESQSGILIIQLGII